MNYLIISALFDERLSGLQLALQHAVVSILLVDLLPVRVHLHHQLRVPLLQPAPRRVRALHLRLHLRQLIQQAAVPVGHCPVVERQYGDDHHQEDEDEGREAASPSVCTKPNHFKKQSVSLLQVVNRNLQSSMRVFSRCKTHPSTWHAAYMRQPLGNANATQKDSHECSRLFTFLLVFTLLPPSAHQASSLQLVQCQWAGWDTPAGTWPSSAGNVKHSRRDETWTATRLRGTEESDYTPHG